jgi:poly-gamma-glutamate synthesis protein (capsule biosynthesis protein)
MAKMSDAPGEARRAERGSRILVIALVGAFLFGMLGFAVAVIDAQNEPAPTAVPAPSLPALPDTLPGAGEAAQDELPSPQARSSRILLALAEPSPSTPPSPVTSTPPVAALDPNASAAPGPSIAVAPVLEPATMPVVPVVSFWSKREGIHRGVVVRALKQGKLDGFKRVVVDDLVADALAAELGIELHPDVRRLDAPRVARAVSKGALGLLAAPSLGPSVRALEMEGRSLVGVERIKDSELWPLSVELEPGPGATWRQQDTWVLLAGGDAFTDRGVYDTVVRKGKGVDYPFDGGTAKVTGHGCCDPVFNDNVVPRYTLTGNKGAVRRLFRQAELAVANHEQPVTEQARFHSSGTRFSGQPALTRIFTRAGIDFLSLANNHIGDYGAEGIRATRRILRQHDIAFGGAGKDLDQARKVELLEANGTKVAIIPCLDIVRAYWAGDAKAGATPCVDQYIKKDIRKAKRAGAGVIVVFPHWGVEYTRQPLASMRKHAARWVEAGADLVIGAHSHVAGSIEEVEGVPVLYSLGNLIFDQHWSTDTMESAMLEATFHGHQVVELRLLPYIIHDTSQPNLLDPAKGEGRRLLLAMKKASSSWLDW